MNEVRTAHYYVSKDFVIKNTEFGSPILVFRNGHRDMQEVRRAVRLCGMRIVNMRDNVINLEVDDGKSEGTEGENASGDHTVRAGEGQTGDGTTEGGVQRRADLSGDVGKTGLPSAEGTSTVEVANGNTDDEGTRGGKKGE